MMPASLEYMEAFLLDKLQHRRLFGQGDYILTMEELLIVIGTAHNAGMVYQSEKTLRKFEQMQGMET